MDADGGQERAEGPVTLDEIEIAVGQRLAGMAGVPPIAWPNASFEPDGIYIEFRHSPADTVDEVVGGGFPYDLGIFLITAVVKSGGHAGEANALAQSIKDRFPKALRLNAGDGRVVINAPPSAGSGFQDGAYWRQPVTLSYITEGGTNEFAAPLDVSPTNDGIERIGDNLRLDIDDLPLAPDA